MTVLTSGSSTTQREFSGLPSSNPDDVPQCRHKDLSVTDAAGLGRPENRLHDFIRKIVGNGDFDFCLWHELDRVFGAAVGFLLSFSGDRIHGLP